MFERNLNISYENQTVFSEQLNNIKHKFILVLRLFVLKPLIYYIVILLFHILKLEGTFVFICFVLKIMILFVCNIIKDGN